MEELNEGAQTAAQEAQDKARAQELASLIEKFPNALSDYPEVELTGNKLHVNEQGARDGDMKKGEEWVGFIYYEAKSEGGPEEPWYGAINPQTGDVISTGSELQWWFD